LTGSARRIFRMSTFPVFARAVGVAAVLSLAAATIAAGASEKSFSLTIKDHRFVPETLHVPAGEAFSLTVTNADQTSEEFESQDFHVEKTVAGGKQITVHVGPLTAGTYGFFGDHHQDTALGNLFAE
jgi:plastocyanin